MSSYRTHHRLPKEGEMGSQVAVCWSEFTRRRLAWLYGDARARQIAEGRDPNTQQDLHAWKRLCALGRAR